MSDGLAPDIQAMPERANLSIGMGASFGEADERTGHARLHLVLHTVCKIVGGRRITNHSNTAHPDAQRTWIERSTVSTTAPGRSGLRR